MKKSVSGASVMTVPAGSVVMVDDKPAVTKKDESVNVISFLTPKHALLMIMKAGIAKCEEPWYVITILGFLAGAYIGLGALLFAVVGGGLTGPGSFGATNPGLPRFAGAAVFPVGLMLVVVMGADLFTGNVMFVTMAWLGRKTTFLKGLKSLVISYFANFLGAVGVAFFLGNLTQIFATEPYQGFITSKVADPKVMQGWGAVFLKGVGANWLVCAAVWLGISSNDFIGKLTGIWWPVFSFVAIGFEHSVANMFLVPMGLMQGCKSNFGEFIAYNLIPSTLGNMLGAAFFLATLQWFIFREHVEPALPYLQPTARSEERRASVGQRPGVMIHSGSGMFRSPSRVLVTVEKNPADDEDLAPVDGMQRAAVNASRDDLDARRRADGVDVEGGGSKQPPANVTTVAVPRV